MHLRFSRPALTLILMTAATLLLPTTANATATSLAPVATTARTATFSLASLRGQTVTAATVTRGLTAPRLAAVRSATARGARLTIRRTSTRIPARSLRLLVRTQPATALVSGPSGTTAATSATIVVTTTPRNATVQCSLDGAPFTTCTKSATFGALGDGEHVVRVRARDRSGHTDASPVRVAWVVDATSPVVTIVAAPAALTSSTSASVAFAAESGATFECALDDAAFTACASPFGVTGLADGSHALQVRARDQFGNLGAARTATWVVDTTPPDVSITSGPATATATNATTASIAFTTEADASTECRLDAGDWTPCTSPFGASGLADGSHIVSIRATDQAGNVDPTPAARTWTIDSTPPDTTITSGPADSSTTNSTSVSFSFTAAGAAAFECRLDVGAWTSCSSPSDATSLVEGLHEFSVRAIDAAGNVDPTPATRDWTVDTVAPIVAITSGPTNASTSTATSASFGFVSDTPATFGCQLDAGIPTSCTTPSIWSALAQGSHTFQLTATDEAGNTTVITITWTIDSVTAAPTITHRSTTSPNEATTITYRGTIEAGGTATIHQSSDCTGTTLASATAAEFASVGLTASLTENATNQFTIRATDAPGNVACSSVLTFVETTPLASDGDTWFNLQWPPTMNTTSGAVSDVWYGQLWINGETNQPAALPDVTAWVGFGPDGTDPRTDDGWTWTPTPFTTQVGNNHEFAAPLTAPATAGNYRVAMRYSRTDGATAWYGALAGPLTDTADLASWTVTP